MSESALQRLVELRSATERLRADFEAADGARRTAAMQRLMLALELRWKLEEQLVIPALGRNVGPPMLALAEPESNRLRELAEVARSGALSPPAGGAVLAAVTALAALRSERIEQALERVQRRKGFDGADLRRDIAAMLERWHEEVKDTGDIEDEEADPVGTPPR